MQVFATVASDIREDCSSINGDGESPPDQQEDGTFKQMQALFGKVKSLRKCAIAFEKATGESLCKFKTYESCVLQLRESCRRLYYRSIAQGSLRNAVIALHLWATITQIDEERNAGGDPKAQFRARTNLL